MTERTIDLEWEGSVVVTDYLITYVPTSPGGVQLEIRVPGNVTNGTIKELEPGIEYSVNVYAVLNNVISIPVSSQVSTCKYTYDQVLPGPFASQEIECTLISPRAIAVNISVCFSCHVKEPTSWPNILGNKK